MVISSAAAIEIGSGSEPRPPEVSWASPRVRVYSSGRLVATMKWPSSFQEPWKDRMVR